jgi:hypothetical protein
VRPRQLGRLTLDMKVVEEEMRTNGRGEMNVEA